MDIFLSWHGPTSHTLARILKRWLPTVLPYAHPWLSSEDIRKGTPWGDELAERLEATSYCIVCITTPQVARSPWVNFEAGAVSKYVDDAHVSPLLIRASPEDLSGLPLARFQWTAFHKKDLVRLLQSINRVTSSPVEDAALKRNLRNTWKQIEDDVDQLKWAEERSSQNDDDGDESDMPLLRHVEEHILLFVAESGPWTQFDDVCDLIQESAIRVEYHLDNLENAGLVLGDASLGYSVTEEGRAYLVENELV